MTYSSLQAKILSVTPELGVFDIDMLDYAICEISGKQYKVIPGKPFEVDFLGDVKQVEAKVLLLSEGEKIEVGTPYLKDSLKLEFVENTRGEKIRVAKFHAKANYRRVIGHKAKLTKVVLPVKKS